MFEDISPVALLIAALSLAATVVTIVAVGGFTIIVISYLNNQAEVVTTTYTRDSSGNIINQTTTIT